MMYAEQLMKTIQGGVYNGSVEYSDLRSLFDKIITTLKSRSVSDQGVVYQVQLSEVDEAYVKMWTTKCLESNSFRVGEYSKDEIIHTLCGHVSEINQQIAKEWAEYDESMSLSNKIVNIPRYTVQELRLKGLE